MTKKKVVEFVSNRETYHNDICTDYRKLSKSFFGIGILFIAMSLFISHVIDTSYWQRIIVLVPIVMGLAISVLFGKYNGSDSEYNLLKADAMAELVRVLVLNGSLIGWTSVLMGDKFLSYYLIAFSFSILCIPLHILFIITLIKKGRMRQKKYGKISTGLIFAVAGTATSIGLYGDKANVIIAFAIITPLLVAIYEYALVKKILRLYYAWKYQIFSK